MFSKLVAAAVLLSSTFAFGYPAVGDKVTWSGSEDKLDGTSTPVSATKEVTTWNTETHKWTVKFDMTKGEESNSKEFVTSCLWSPEDWVMMAEMCAEKGGTMEDLTVGTGTYSSCRMTVTADDGRVIKTWMGDVPFGLIKKEITNVTEGTTTRMELESITNGTPGT